MAQGITQGIKYALFIANVIISFGGIVAFAIGVWSLQEKSFMERLLGSSLYVASAGILIGTGISVAVISFIGSVGAYKELRCVLITFFAILLVIFIVMLIGGILGYVFRAQVDEQMHKEMIRSVPRYNTDKKYTDAWDAVQKTLECCGVLPYTDSKSHIKNQGRKPYEIWFKEGKFKPQNLPETCCLPKPPPTTVIPGAIQQDPTRSNSNLTCTSKSPIYQEGCYDKAKNFVKQHALLIGGIGVGIASLLLIGMILSCLLIVLIEDDGRH